MFCLLFIRSESFFMTNSLISPLPKCCYHGLRIFTMGWICMKIVGSNSPTTFARWRYVFFFNGSCIGSAFVSGC